MLRQAMTTLAQNGWIKERVSENGFSKGFALRFVAGETLDEAIAIVSELNRQRLSVTLDALGENVSTSDEAESATRTYCSMLDRLAETKVNSNISVKLTMLGLDLSEKQCVDNLNRVLERAKERGNFIWIDMEGSPYTQKTLDIAYEARKHRPDGVGIVLQAYLYRTERDVRDAIDRQIPVRLVKGAYAEPATLAFPRKIDVDAAYRREMELLLDGAKFAAIATHDPYIIEAAKGYIERMNVDRSRFEFQLLYGVRRDLQRQLVQEGYNVRLYVPYGTQWYPYFMRRMAERPANLLFVLRNLTQP
ncbi:MAG TPA: proline dehydrogenase family protein [Thermomicrobiaceae bacterium]|nr:proline dehydrogenase family protein [Thermomicrobiaceae bacterium]